MKAKTLRKNSTLEPRNMAQKIFGEDGLAEFKELGIRTMIEEKYEQEKNEHLQEIKKLKLRNCALEKEVSELSESLEANVQDRERVITHRTNKIVELQQENDRLQSALDLETENSAAKFLTLSNTSCDEKIKYEKTIDDLRFQLSQLTEFQKQKRNMEGCIVTLREIASLVDEKHKEQLREIELKYLQDAEDIKLSNSQELSRHKSEIEAKLASELDETSARSIQENGRLNVEINYQSAQVEKLVADNLRLSRKNKDLINQTEVQLAVQTQLSRKVKFYERLFKKMQLKEQNAIGADPSVSEITKSRVEPVDNRKETSSLVGDLPSITLPLSQLIEKPTNILRNATDELEEYLVTQKTNQHQAMMLAEYGKYAYPTEKGGANALLKASPAKPSGKLTSKKFGKRKIISKNQFSWQNEKSV